MFERLYGPDHYEIAVNLNNLAAVMEATGKAEEAEHLYRRALELKKRLFGPEHPEVALTAKNLSFLLRNRT